MSVNCVPPGSVELSPVVSYQNGVGPESQPASLNELERQALVSGTVEASVVPFQYFQKALLLISTAAGAGTARVSPKRRTIPARNARIVFITDLSVLAFHV